MKSRMEPKAGRGGRSLLAGLLRCRRCGRMLHVAYSGKSSEVPRYHCRGAQINHGEAWCISFGGLRPDQAIAAEVLKAVEGNAVEAAVEAAARIAEQRSQQRQAQALELEQAQYEARLAARRYEAVDPDNRLVAAELEARWNAALCRVGEVEGRLRHIEATSPGAAKIPDKEILFSLAQDLPTVWNAETTDMRLKQRITRILIQEIVADVDDTAGEDRAHDPLGWRAAFGTSRQKEPDGSPQSLHQSGGNRDHPSNGGPLPRRSNRSDPESTRVEDWIRQHLDRAAGARRLVAIMSYHLMIRCLDRTY